MRRLRLILSVIAAAILTGCGGGHIDVTGTVTYQGKPVTQGRVSLIGSDNIQYTGAIKPDGTFTVMSVPRGQVKIGVTSNDESKTAAPRASKTGASRAGATPENYSPPPPNTNPVPESFNDPLKSGLTGEVGKTQLAIDIKQ